MMRRGSMELSVGTLIVMILGLAIIIGGTVLVWKLVDAGTGKVQELTGADKARLQDLLTRGQLVAAVPATQAIAPGKSATFGVGVLNKLDGEKEFTILVDIVDARQQRVQGWQVLYFPTLTVERDADATALVDVTPAEDTPAGDYTALVTVTADGQPYDSTRFFTVRVG